MSAEDFDSESPHCAPLTREDAVKEGWFVCYECRDKRCGYCIGIPCMCPCPIPETEPEYSI